MHAKRTLHVGSNFVYAITCLTCKIQYVGQTNWTILERFQGHYANANKAPRNPGHPSGHTSNAHINQPQGDTIGLHFAQSTYKGTKRPQELNTME